VFGEPSKEGFKCRYNTVFFWEGVGADSNYCEVSFDLIIFLLFLEALSAVLIVCFYIVALLLLII